MSEDPPHVDTSSATPSSRVDARVRVLFLVVVAVGVFFLHALWQVAAAAALLAVFFLAVGLPPKKLLRHVWKLWGFALFVFVSYAFFDNDPDVDEWTQLPYLRISINVTGLLAGAAMMLRVYAVIFASQIARAGDARAIAAGLRKLGVPAVVAASIDTVLALLGSEGAVRHGSGMGGGRGRGDGGGGGGANRGAGFWAAVKRIARGDVHPIVARLSRQIERAEDHARSLGLDERAQEKLRDVGVIAGVALTMLGIKALKILPSIPFAPGHKLVVLTPLYIVAGMLSKGRAGATLTGLTMGTVAFLLGDGKYGVLEIAKHVTPGILTDLCLPLLLGGGRRPGGVVWALFGGALAAGRFATIFAATLLVQAPAAAYAILIPGLTVHITFGLASGYITFHIVKAVDRLPGTQQRFPPRTTPAIPPTTTATESAQP